MTGLDEAFTGKILLTGSVAETDTRWEKVGILFDFIQDETSTVEAEITDNWVESNYTLQDHIAVKPRIYRIRGCVGEVVYENIYRFIDKFDAFVTAHDVAQNTLNVLKGVSALSGTVSNYTQAALNVTKQIESSYDRYKKIFDNFTKANQVQGRRQAALYEILVYMMQQRLPVKLTKLTFGENVFPDLDTYDKQFFIQSVSAHQGDNSFISDIEVTIKEVRVATTRTTKADSSKYGGFIASQKAQEAQNGLSKSQNVSTDKPLVSVTAAMKKAESISNAPKQTFGGAIKTFTLKALEEVKIRIRDF